MVVGIIGGGASGMAAALRAAENPDCREWEENSRLREMGGAT